MHLARINENPLHTGAPQVHMSLLMVIDEERDSCTLIARVLRREGYKVAAFTHVEDAVGGLKKNAPDLCIVSAGKYGENAKEIIGLLRGAGIQGGNIVLCA